jgi:hypothetical protein
MIAVHGLVPIRDWQLPLSRMEWSYAIRPLIEAVDAVDLRAIGLGTAIEDLGKSIRRKGFVD